MKHDKVGIKTKKGAIKPPISTLGPGLSDSHQSFLLRHYRNIGNQVVQRMLEAGTLQPKLKIGSPGDKYEQEAERVADRVMRMEEESLVSSHLSLGRKEDESAQTKPLAEQITPIVQRQALEEGEEELFQVKESPGRTPEVKPGIESSINAMKGGGQPLSESTREFFEPRFGTDFNEVRLHTASQAAETAKSINAKAFTIGKDVAFGAGQYSPGTSSGKRLLAHELTHVVQQKKDNELQLKSIKVGDPELPKKKDLSFTAATVLGESSVKGPIGEKIGIAMVIKRRVEEKWGGNTTFRDIILNSGIHGRPTKRPIARLAELYLNNPPKTLQDFKKLVDKTEKLSKSDSKYLISKSGFNGFKSRVEQCKKATESVLVEKKVEENLTKIKKEATWWGGEVDMWNTKTGKIWRHGARIVKGTLVFAVYKQFGKTYFLKEATSITDNKGRAREIERSKKFLCNELVNKTKWTKNEIEKENPTCK